MYGVAALIFVLMIAMLVVLGMFLLGDDENEPDPEQT